MLFGVILAGWVFVDSRKRGANAIKWSLGALVMGPIFAAIYQARRPLLEDETREGGPDWIVARNFAWLWLPYMGIVVFWTIVTLFFTDQWDFADDSSATTVRNLLTTAFVLACWLIPVAFGLLLSVLLVVPDVVERKALNGDTITIDTSPQE